MTSDQHEREMKTLKAKPFDEESNDNKIHNRVPSRTRKLSVDIYTEDSLTMKLRLILFTNSTNEEGEEIFAKNMSD